MPTLLVNAYKSGSVLDGRVQALAIMSRDEIIQLIQWTDMIVFDYITGHYDRSVFFNNYFQKIFPL